MIRTTSTCLLILVLAACAVNESVTPTEPASSTAVLRTRVPVEQTKPTSTHQASLLSIAEPTGTPAQAPLPTQQSNPAAVPSSTPTDRSTTLPLVGPLLALRVEGGSEIFLSLFDVGTTAFREIRNEIVGKPFEPQWFGDGCQLFIDGNFLDLRGNVLWQAPEELREVAGNFSGTRLSPDRRWLAYPIFSGAQTYESTEFVDIGVISLTSPFSQSIVTRNGGAESGAVAWSSDEQWLFFSDYDDNGILQIYRASPDGESVRQLTFHTNPLAKIDYVALSPDGRYLAYAVTNLLFTTLPYQFDPKDEGWVGILSLADLKASRIAPPKFGGILDNGMWWSPDSSRIVYAGTSLPVSIDDPLEGRQVHWASADGGMLTASLYENDTPAGSMGLMAAVGSPDTVLFNSPDGLYLFHANERQFQLLGDFDPGRLIRSVASAPFDFPGERDCAAVK